MPSLAGKVDLRRYSRHLLIPEVGLAGQEKLAAARVLVVGAGELEMLGEGDVVEATTLHAGEVLFPSEVLRAAPAPATVRAAKGGALIFFADRGVAQELLVTCPPLLEIFAGG